MAQPNPEQKAFRPMPEQPADLESAYKKASEVTQRDALQLESFLYKDKSGSNREAIDYDLSYVEKRKQTFEDLDSPEYKLAKSLEAALHERVNKDNWFGERAKMIMPSEYDDLANGIDGIVEFEEGVGSKSHLGLAVDVTYSQNPSKKFDIVKEQIDQGRLGKVKYFRSSDGTFEKPLDDLPRAVLVLNSADATRVVRDWDKGTPDKGNEFRVLILRQLEAQLIAYQAYTKNLELGDAERDAISHFFEGPRRNVSALIADIASPEDLSKIDQHPTMKTIREQLEKFSA